MADFIVIFSACKYFKERRGESKATSSLDCYAEPRMLLFFYHYPHSLGVRGVEGDLTVVGSGLYDIRGMVGDVEAVAGDRVGLDGERHVNGLAGVGLGIGEVVAVETHRVGGELQHGAIPGYVNILLGIRGFQG